MASLTLKRPLDENESEQTNKKIKTQKTRAFQESWKVDNNWLRFDNESKSMYCDLCIKVQNSNTFTVGCNILKKDSVTKHAKSKDHTHAVDASKQSVFMKSACDVAITKSEAAVTAALKNVYFAAKQNLASSVVPALNAHCINQGVSQLCDLRVDGHTTYEHHQSINEFQECIAESLHLELLEKMKHCPKFSLMLDESTDVSVSQNLICYVKILESDCFGSVYPVTHFLGISDLSIANAESIYVKVCDILLRKCIDIANLCGVSSDGASVMVGHKSGVVTRLKEHVPGVLATHCIAHRLALSCCSSADSLPYLVKFQETLNSIYKYFRNSPKNMSKLSAIQSILEGQTLRFKEVFHTRWLSFEGAVDALVTNYPSLVSLFLEEKSGKALSLYKPIATFKFLYTAHFLCDALKPIAILSKMYQKKDLCYSEVTPLLTATIQTLEHLSETRSGPMMKKFLKVTPQTPEIDKDGLFTFEYEGHTITDSVKQRTEAESVCQKFMNNMVTSLNSRFSDNSDGSVLTAMSNLFNPSIPVPQIHSDIDTVSDYLGTVGIEGSQSELLCFANFARASHNSGNKSVIDIHSAANLAIKNVHSYPASAEAAKRLLVSPVSTVDCERGFSRQNVIKTDLRNCLTVKNLEHLMKISIEGKDCKDVDFKVIYKLWAGKKQRRIIMK